MTLSVRKRFEPVPMSTLTKTRPNQPGSTNVPARKDLRHTTCRVNGLPCRCQARSTWFAMSGEGKKLPTKGMNWSYALRSLARVLGVGFDIVSTGK